MPTKLFTSGRIRQADYQPGGRQLALHFHGGTVLAYKHVPEEVFRRLCSAPNPTTYWEDRIAEEYPMVMQAPAPPGANSDKRWSDLFGGEAGAAGSGESAGDRGRGGD